MNESYTLPFVMEDLRKYFNESTIMKGGMRIRWDTTQVGEGYSLGDLKVNLST